MLRVHGGTGGWSVESTQYRCGVYAMHCLKFYSRRVSRRAFLLHNSMACKRSNISSFVSQVSSDAWGIFKLVTLYEDLLVSCDAPTKVAMHRSGKERHRYSVREL